MKRKLLKRLHDNRGFTFMEIMIVVLIIGILLAIVGVNIIGQFKQAKERTTRIQIKNIEHALILFKANCGFFPTDEQGLEALVEAPSGGKDCKGYPDGGFMDQLSADAWGQPFNYANPPTHGGKAYDIWSEGRL